MNEPANTISSAFMSFRHNAPDHAKAWAEMVQQLGQASALDGKTASLAYLAVLASQRALSGIPFHVHSAKESGATRSEVISAILVGLPVTGHLVTQALPAAIEAYDAS